jgi:hypothetical protein
MPPMVPATSLRTALAGGALVVFGQMAAREEKIQTFYTKFH